MERFKQALGGTTTYFSEWVRYCNHESDEKGHRLVEKKTGMSAQLPNVIGDVELSRLTFAAVIKELVSSSMHVCRLVTDACSSEHLLRADAPTGKMGMVTLFACCSYVDVKEGRKGAMMLPITSDLSKLNPISF